jgi:protein-S-isoprenylcysteine O-methyltransferase Ste14
MNQTANLKRRSIRRFLMTLLILGWLLFLPADSWRFWQAWLLLGLMAGFWTFFFLYFLKYDPQLLERRLQRLETDPEQRRFQKIFPLILFLALIVASLDFRFGWSRSIAPVPLAVIVAGQIATVAGYGLVFWVMKTNSFAASTIQVEAAQAVIQRGPYAIVRHPMYLGMAITALGMPLALGSYVALPLFALQVPLLMYRLIHEERTLCRDLAGYVEYCQLMRNRLLPWLW